MSYSIKINYITSGESTPLDPKAYIIADKNNPTSIESGETVILRFVADGIYFGFKSRKGVEVSGANSTWECEGTNATITLNNAISDVIVTITAVTGTTPQLVSKPFLFQMPAPVDTRLVLSKQEMKEINDNYLPDVYFALCKDDGHFYLYNKTAGISEETGRFRIITDVINTGTPEFSIICGGNAFSD